MEKTSIYGYLSLLLLLCFSCQEDEAVPPSASFTKLYFDGNMSTSYEALDMIAVGNSYVMLSSTDPEASPFPGIYVAQADEAGNLVGDHALPPNYVNPVPNLVQLNGAAHFFCSDRSGGVTYLMRISGGGGEVAEVQVFPDIAYPLAASSTADGALLVVGYERDSRSTTLTKINPNLSVAWQERFAVQEDMEPVIFDHLTRQGERFPFFTGSTHNGDTYFFNAFFNYTLSVVFVDGNSGASRGVMNGFRQGGGISTMEHISGEEFAFSRFAFGKVYLFPNATVGTGDIGNSEQYDGFEMNELQPNAAVSALYTNVNGSPVTFFAGNSKSNSIVVYAYHPDTGSLMGKLYRGYNDDLNLAAMVATADGGMALFATTQMAGRFPRPILMKIPPQALHEIVMPIPTGEGG